MADVEGQVGGIVSGFMPSLRFGMSGISFITWVIIIIMTLILVGVVTYFIVRLLKYNRKIILFEKINGRFTPTRKDRACEMKFGTAGDTIFYMLKAKKYLPTPTKQMGKRVYWYFIREDSEWINFELADLDELSRQAGAFFLDKEARLSRTQIDRSLERKYEKIGFFAKYGIFIVTLAYLVIIGVMMWLLFDKWVELAGTINSAMQMVPDILDKQGKILSALNNVCEGGSGMIPV